MSHKLVLIFDEDSEVNNINKCLIFNNELDAEQYLLANDYILSIKLEPKDYYFSFKTIAWSGSGKAYWAKEF